MTRAITTRLLCALACASSLPLVLAACDKKKSGADAGAGAIDLGNFPPVDIANLEFASSGTLFVPIHTYLPMGDGVHPLKVTLGIFNTDLQTPIIVSSVRLHDEAGTLKKAYLDEAHSLAPLASTKFTLDASETRQHADGTTASFVVEWEAEEPVSEPVVEAVMAQWLGTHAYAFVCPSRKIEPAASENKPHPKN